MSDTATTLPIAQTHLPNGTWDGPAQVCALDYEARFIRRKRLETTQGLTFLLDLAQTTSLDHGDAVVLQDGRQIEIQAADEAVLVVKGGDLARLAWHIGNRHTPCQIEGDHLVIRDDPVIGHMLEHLGATLSAQTAPFTPEGGAYGMGRTHSHAHGATAHDH